MKRVVLAFLFTLPVLLMNAQRIYFVYFQTETGEPFFIRMDDKLYSSSASGYLILPRLKDSTYSFKLGFPGKTVDLDFSTAINKKDHGFLIKNFGEKGWGLFDLQSLNIQMSSSATRGTSRMEPGSSTQINAFTDLLSRAADDPSLKQNLVLVKDEEKKPEVIQAVNKEERKAEVNDAVAKEEKKLEPVPQPVDKTEAKKPEIAFSNPEKGDSSQNALKAGQLYKRSQVTRISSTVTTDGTESIFVDQYPDGSRDTVRILIPAEKTLLAKEEVKVDSLQDDKKFLDISTDTTQMVNKPAPGNKKDESKKWWPFGKNKDVETNKQAEVKSRASTRTPLFKKNKNETASQPKPVEQKNQASNKWNPFKKKNDGAVTKSCRASANNDDFLKLRRRMAGRTNDDGMLDEARKYFKEKCFTTEQIKNLSSMFLSSAGKFNFFEASHDHVSDMENFFSLQSELKDEKYIDRFRSTFSN